VLAWGLRHRIAVVTLALASVAAGVVAAARVPLDFMSVEDRSEFNIWLKMPLGSTVEQTRAAATKVEQESDSDPR
jgi:multidrug efflux pump subunit AcrB